MRRWTFEVQLYIKIWFGFKSYLCFCSVCLGYKPESNKGKSNSHKHVKRDEVVLFDNVKEYSHKPGE